MLFAWRYQVSQELGRNTLRVTTHPPPGLLHTAGPSLDYIGVTLGPPPSP
jgi:hypothetical protein